MARRKKNRGKRRNQKKDSGNNVNNQDLLAPPKKPAIKFERSAVKINGGRRVRGEDCPHCGKRIEDLSCAFWDKNLNQLVHFECLLDKLRESENLSDGERIVYIGNGQFAVVLENKEKSCGFDILRYIQVEEKEEDNWRESMAIKIEFED